jgi:hypothetical protein
MHIARKQGYISIRGPLFKFLEEECVLAVHFTKYC